MRQPLHLVDVFARERYAGNQLAVVTDASDLDDAEMQAFAAEIDFSETTYIEADADADPRDDGGWPATRLGDSRSPSPTPAAAPRVRP